MNISHSKIKTWRQCHKKYDYRYNVKIQKKVKSKPLEVGSLIHKCIEYYLLGKDYKIPIQNFQKKLDKMFEEEALEHSDTIPLCYSMMEFYINRNIKRKVKAVELTVKVPLIEDIVFEGKIDALLKENKKVWVGEHKSCKVIPDETTRMSDIQTILYLWALEKMGYERPVGVIWEYLRKKIPSVPKLLKSGGISKAACDTTDKVYLQTILDNGLNPKDYKKILDKLAGNEQNFFIEVKMPVSEKIVSTVVKDLESSALQIKKLGHIATDRNMTIECKWCEYFNLCQSDLRGSDTEFLIKKYYERIKKRPKKI